MAGAPRLPCLSARPPPPEVVAAGAARVAVVDNDGTFDRHTYVLVMGALRLAEEEAAAAAAEAAAGVGGAAPILADPAAPADVAPRGSPRR